MKASALSTASSRHLAKTAIVVSIQFPVPIDEKNGLTAQQTFGVIIMKEEYRGFRPGDRVQMIECKDPYAPISPGAKGTVAHIDDAGTLHMLWDNGRTLGVCLEEDIVRKVPPEQEMELLSTEPLLQCGEGEWDAHCEQSVALTSAMQSYAEGQDCDWAVKRSYIDEAHSHRAPRYQHVEAAALDDLIEGTCDLKNGTDVGFMAKRPPSERSMAIVAYGQSYTAPSGTYLVKELLEAQARLPCCHTRLQGADRSRLGPRRQSRHAAVQLAGRPPAARPAYSKMPRAYPRPSWQRPSARTLTLNIDTAHKGAEESNELRPEILDALIKYSRLCRSCKD